MSGLLAVASPPHVAMFVVPIVVRESIDRHSIGAFAHVSEEVRKPVLTLPSRAHRDPATSVAIPSHVLLVRAAFDHPAPRLMGWRSGLAMAPNSVACRIG